MTTNLLSVIEQQHKALEEWERVDVLGRDPHIHRESWRELVQDRNIKHTAALAAGQQALEQAQGEPVAWMSPGKERLEFSRKDTVYGSHTIPLYAHPQATEPASPSDAELLDFIEEHPHLALRKHKNRWSFVGLTNYEYPTFETAREAVKAALVASTY